MSPKVWKARQAQPIEELRRKADKACRRANIWTVEELDYAKAHGRLMAASLAEIFRSAPARPKPSSDRMAVGE